MEMGRLIRAKRLAVVVAHTHDRTLPAQRLRLRRSARRRRNSRGAYCASACTLVLAAGVERYVSPLSFVGVHQLTQVLSKTTVKRAYKVRYVGVAWFKWELSRKLVGVNRSTSTIKRAADSSVIDIVADYFTEMGIGDPVMELTLVTPDAPGALAGAGGTCQLAAGDDPRRGRFAGGRERRRERARRRSDRRAIRRRFAVRRKERLGAAGRPRQDRKRLLLPSRRRRRARDLPTAQTGGWIASAPDCC